nr:MAG: hypothetical protein [Hemigrapsus takanoi nimavirus]
MDWSSVLGKRLKLDVDKANAAVTAAGSGIESPAPFSSSSIKKRREDGANSSKATATNATAAVIGNGKKTPVPFSSSSIKKQRDGGANSSKAAPPAGGIRKYIKTLSVLTILTVIFSIVIVGVAIMTASSKKFDVESITENDIPLAIGAGIGQTSVMAALFSTISPMGLLEETDLDREKKQKEDEKKKKNNNSNSNKKKKSSTSTQKSTQNSKRKTKTKRPRGRRPRRTRAMRSRKMPARYIRKSPRGLRFLRGLLRLLIEKR